MTATTSLSSETIYAAVQQYFAASRIDQPDQKVAAMVACFAPDSISYDPAEGPGMRGHSELQQFFSSIATLFITVGLTADFISINGNQAAVKWAGQGTSQDGRQLTFEGIDVFEFNAAGQIQTMRAYWNPTALLAELEGAE
jgi:steroid delta-isomerase